jgi:urease accessory protein
MIFDVLPLVVAHIVPGVTDFYAGLLHPLTAVEHVLVLAAVGLLAGQQARPVALRTLLLFVLLLAASAACAGAIGAAVPLDTALLVSIVATGGLVAARWPLPAGVVYVVVGLVAMLHGVANVAEMRPTMSSVRFAAGGAVAAFVVTTYALGIARRARAPWAEVAVRVAGSWIAAVGILAWGAAAL